MTGLKTGLAVVVVVGGLAGSARAQGIVPGGWAPQFGYQTFGGAGISLGTPAGYPGFGGMVSPYGGAGFSPVGNPYIGGVSPYGIGGGPYGFRPMVPMGPGLSGLPGAAPAMPQTVNGMGPLMQAIGQSTRRSGRR
jgi:hypothetical protein